MFFLSQISLCKSLQPERRTDERRKLISAMAHSLSCIHKAYVMCRASCEKTGRESLQVFLFKLHRSFSYLLSSTVTSSRLFFLLWLCTRTHTTQLMSYKLLRADQDADQNRASEDTVAEVSLALGDRKKFLNKKYIDFHRLNTFQEG